MEAGENGTAIVVSDDGHKVRIRLRGEHFLIDGTTFDFIKDKRCYVADRGYISLDHEGKRFFLHRFLMGNPKGYFVDHINNDTRDNRICNLRVVHPSQNNANARRFKANQSGFRGVRVAKGKYEASILFNKRQIYIGRFVNAEEAAKAYDLKAIECFGGSCITNFHKSNYVIPNVCLSDELAPVEIAFNKNNPECAKESCDKKSVSGSDLCRYHTDKRDFNEERAFKGNKVYRPRVKHKLDFCKIPACDRVVFCSNLCSPHYDALLKTEGYIKPPKLKYYCSVEGCEKQADKIAERLCRNHWNEKGGIITKRTGRPKAARIPCRECGKDASVNTGLCKDHYLEKWKAEKKDGTNRSPT